MSETNQQEQKPKEPEPSTKTLLAMLTIFFGTRRIQELREQEKKNG